MLSGVYRMHDPTHARTASSPCMGAKKGAQPKPAKQNNSVLNRTDCPQQDSRLHSHCQAFNQNMLAWQDRLYPERSSMSRALARAHVKWETNSEVMWLETPCLEKTWMTSNQAKDSHGFTDTWVHPWVDPDLGHWKHLFLHPCTCGSRS